MKIIIHAQLVSYFEDNNLFTDAPYGYRSGCSTKLASTELTDRIYNHLSPVFIDLKKAFGTLDHNILIHKLDHYGIIGVAKQIFDSYITNR